MIANCIHFPHRTDRYNMITEESRIQNFDIEWWEPDRNPKAHISCRKSHQAIIRWAQDHGLKEVLIMEDDCRFVHPDSFLFFLTKKPEVYDLYLGGLHDYHWKDEPAGLLEKSFSGFHCYFVSSTFYDQFLSCDDEYDHIDRWCAKQQGQFYCCNPMVCVQQVSFSDIRKRVTDHELRCKNRKFFNGFGQEPTNEFKHVEKDIIQQIQR